MAFNVTPESTFNDTMWLSHADSIPVDLWHHAGSFIVEKPNFDEYIIINEQVIHITPTISTMTSVRRFKHKKWIPKMHRKSFGSKLQDSFISFDLLEGRKTIQEVLAF
jgi:hypothetical protein